MRKYLYIQRLYKDNVPYIYHPLLHDVCEGCRITTIELSVNDVTRTTVVLPTKGKMVDEVQYFGKIVGNQIATMIKILDRCNNASGMARAFSEEKLAEYIKEAEKFIYPLMDKLKSQYPEYADQLFLIKYHMKSVAESVKRLG